ncbi:thioredoxin [Ornithinimicrobium pekingense]|uniref:Thioredoxin n=1 Tax=Ornithinimicrobium pekingense TaxID=384677 RepID=A0ABQ2F850_9MICO|nr:thioredoxin [Ornithinimicrobium pekingense]GGK63072.1 thioredoxin [Ornithinimicrobium pekingense]
MSTRELTVENFEETVTGNDIVLVDWWADWCGPCKMFAPVYDKAAEQHEDVVFAKVDTESQQALAAGAQITSIPTLMAFKDGMLVFRQAGALPARDLESVISQIKDLDMDEVRAKVAAQSAQDDPSGTA